jgi:hypothetical protein
MTPFEQRLADTPHREIPAELRARILAAAQPGKTFPVLLVSFFTKIFSFPHPLAWGAVAAAWIAIAALNFTGPRGPELYAVTPKDYKGRLPTPGEYLVQFELRDKFIASLSRSADEFPIFVYYPRRENL